MNTKQKVALIFLILIFVTSCYGLYEIDRHEKALIGQVWLNPVPDNVWREYLRKEAVFEEKYSAYKKNNAQLIELVKQYEQTHKLTLKRNSNSLLNPELMQSLKEAIDTQSGLTPNPLSILSPEAEKKFSQEHPDEFKIYKSIKDDLETHRYKTPKPSNPPKPAIEQAIQNYYRIMFAADGILILGLILFMFLCKERGAGREKV